MPLDDTASRRQARNIERQLDRFRSKLEGLADAVEDPTITYFDRLNVGMVFVDEAHLAKNIALDDRTRRAADAGPVTARRRRSWPVRISYDPATATAPS